ncbi:hypothetical protein N7474_006215 [Penicillium riverlandense]|uniref:uncharacterized protein n=1 Tax=Penicillium riverlandense TaxID=1903569 RepID=UPI002546B660|nr:uncharacterized protein N7474_006214 [Penicillium riverlandense]XP_057055026.1 uncharacterized protein N7474_006215 [Penicillium riverlandense]KAJ5820623.1 hypothetical protein N7474_006214 [Penicillium riverlandense]KAJ5820624.1 hypothetical protein N7474_006215 [Penicillium riverlandense]
MQLTTIATIVGLAAAVVAAPSSQSAKNMASSDPSSPPDWLLQAKQEKSWSLCCVSGSSPPDECEYSADPDAKCPDSTISWTCHWKASFDDSSYDDLEGKIVSGPPQSWSVH